MDRYKLFYQLKQWIENTDSCFPSNELNIFQACLSPMMIDLAYHAKHGSPQEYPSNSIKSAIKLWLKRKVEILRYSNTYKSTKGTSNSIILFIAVEPTHVKQFEPIWDELKKQAWPYKVATNRKHMYNQIKAKHDVVYLPYERSFAKAEIEIYKSRLKDCLISKGVEDFGLPIQVLTKTSSRVLESFVLLRKQFSTMLGGLVPSAVFVGTDTTMEGRICVLLAKSLCIPSFCVMHGSVTGEPMDTYHQVDTFFTYGEAAKQDLIAQGVSPQQLVVSGAPYLQSYKNRSEEGIHKQLEKELNLTKLKPYILFAHSGAGNSTSMPHYQSSLESLYQTAEKYPDVQWIVKLHRKDDPSNFSVVKSKFPNSPIQVVDKEKETKLPVSIFDWLRGASCMITGNSTVAIEAMFMDVPVVTMDLMGEYNQVDFIDKGCTYHVRTREELDRAVSKILNGTLDSEIHRKALEYAANYFYSGDRTPSQEILFQVKNRTQPQVIE